MTVKIIEATTENIAARFPNWPRVLHMKNLTWWLKEQPVEDHWWVAEDKAAAEDNTQVGDIAMAEDSAQAEDSVMVEDSMMAEDGGMVGDGDGTF